MHSLGVILSEFPYERYRTKDSTMRLSVVEDRVILARFYGRR